MNKKAQKGFQDRRKKESSLISDLKDLGRLGSFLNQCMQQDAKSKKYKIAKRRYFNLLDNIDSTTEKLTSMIVNQEKDLQKEQTRTRLAKADQELKDKDKENIENQSK